MKCRIACLVLFSMIISVAVVNADDNLKTIDRNPASVSSKNDKSASSPANSPRVSDAGAPIDGHHLKELKELGGAGAIGSNVFPTLHEERRWALDEDTRLKNRIDSIKSQVHEVVRPLQAVDRSEYDAQIHRLNSEIDENEKKQLVGPTETDKVDAHLMLISLTRQKGTLGAAWEESQKYEADDKQQQSLRQQLNSAVSDREIVSDYLLSLDDTINSMLLTTDANNLFKTWICIAFSVLVGLVIVGFFFIAAREKNIRDLIFSNDSGLQFVTLFSLIIAIILFGVIGVLEGRELAALLGGLSGYILGRGNLGLQVGRKPAGDGSPSSDASGSLTT
jgi:hypothetical protein